MSQIIYRKGSLFNAPVGSYLAHATNTYGTWGAGIAAEFRKRFQISHQEYQNRCSAQDTIEGTTFITSEKVVCLMTSCGVGAGMSRREKIVYNTIYSLRDLFDQLPPDIHEIHSNKFNSGLFHVPWEDTAVVLRGTMDLYGPPDLLWTVWDPNLK